MSPSIRVASLTQPTAFLVSVIICSLYNIKRTQSKLSWYTIDMKLEIDTRTFIRFWLVISALGLAALLFFIARQGLMILGISFFLALALNAPVAQIAKRLPGKSRVGATALSYVAVLVVLSSVVFLVIPPIVQQTAKFAQSIPAAVDSFTNRWGGLNDFVEDYNLQPQLNAALESINTSAGAWAGDIGQNIIGGIGSFFAFSAAAILVLVLTFLMLVEGPQWIDRLWANYRNKERMKVHRRVVTDMYKTVNGYVIGQLSVSAIGAVIAGFAVFMLSFVFPEISGNLAMPTAAVTFVLSLIPMFGATIGGAIITALLAFNSIPAAIIYVVFFVVYQQVENNFISPQIQAKKIDLSPLAVLAAVTLGLYMFGVIGGIIAIPIAGCIKVLVNEYLRNRNKRRGPDIKLA